MCRHTTMSPKKNNVLAGRCRRAAARLQANPKPSATRDFRRGAFSLDSAWQQLDVIARHHIPCHALIGPANAGKTEFFLTLPSHAKKYIVSTLPTGKSLLPLNNCFDLNSFTYVNLNRAPSAPEKAPFILLADECHLFTQEHLVALAKWIDLNKTNIIKIYVALLTGSAWQRPFDNQCCGWWVAMADDISIISGHCTCFARCLKSTTNAPTQVPANDIAIGKNKYRASCLNCLNSEAQQMI